MEKKDDKKKKRNKYAVLTVGLIFIGVILIVVGNASSFFIADSDGYWEWHLNVGDNEVSFTSSQIASCYSDSPEDVFRSICDETDFELSVFEDGTNKNWKYGEGGNTLLHISAKPGKYHILISGDLDEELTLRIADKNADYWKLHFKQGWNRIVYHQNQLDTFSNDDPVTVLSSIDPYWGFIFDGENLNDNYWYNQPEEYMNGGSLQHVKDNVLYLVHVIQDCDYTINDYIPQQPDIDIYTNTWITSVAGFFCILGGFITGVKTLLIKG